MRISARNQLQGTVTKVNEGAVTTIVEIEIGGGQKIVSSITAEAARDLELREGRQVTAIVKASDVIVATD
jgi:molybdopterin-binding protein